MSEIHNQYPRQPRKYEPIAMGSIDGTDKEPHDNGIVRAINSDYTPDKTINEDVKCTIFVGRLNPRVEDEELKEIFGKFGKIRQCHVIRDIVTGISKQYAFVEFKREQYADNAYRKGHKMLVHGAEVIVDRTHGRTMKGWKPRRLGGGFGGRKEAGQLRFGCRERPWLQPIHLPPGQGLTKDN